MLKDCLKVWTAHVQFLHLQNYQSVIVTSYVVSECHGPSGFAVCSCWSGRPSEITYATWEPPDTSQKWLKSLASVGRSHGLGCDGSQWPGCCAIVARAAGARAAGARAANCDGSVHHHYLQWHSRLRYTGVLCSIGLDRLMTHPQRVD